MVLRPASIRLAMAISPSRLNNSTLPISRRYIRTGSSVRSSFSSLPAPSANSPFLPISAIAVTFCSSSSTSSASMMLMPISLSIDIIEADDVEEEEQKVTAIAEIGKKGELALGAGKEEKLDRTDDPVRMYLREMGSVELLSREGEIAIAKRIEAGRNTMIAGLCESPLTFQAITIWRDELLGED